VAAGGQATGGRHAAAQYNLLDIDGKPGAWSVRLTRRGLTGPAAPPIDIEVVDLASEPRSMVRS
jgi:hypothetical protein